MSRSRSPRDLPDIVVSETLAGVPGIVDLWCFFYGIADAAHLASYDMMMTPEERTRARRYVFERDRRLYQATRALVRTVLSAYAAVRPGAWRFAQRDNGKPFIASPKIVPYIHFNLSNTQGLVVCAVSVAHEEVGVDTELQRRDVTISSIGSYFAASEVQTLRALPVDQQARRFYEYWTLKESYVKARGHGLSLPLDQFALHFDHRGDIGISFDERLVDDPARWRFALVNVSPMHVLAVSVRTDGAPLSLRFASIIPPPVES